MKKKAPCLIYCLLISAFLIAQVSITNDNSSSHPSAMLDVKSNSKGILVPRLSTTERNAILSPAKGLMVYDSTINSFFFFNGTSWLNVSSGSAVANQIVDADNDTKVQVEANADEDKIRFKTANFEQLVLDGKSARLQSPGNSLFVGVDAGLNDDGTNNSNLFIGVNAGKDNVNGSGNTFIGQSAGRKNTTHNNTFIGNSSGFNNTSGSGNTFVGETTGFNNSTGFSNTFIGATAGQVNSTGSNNTFLGHAAGSLNSSGSDNTMLGQNAGAATTASENTFVGKDAGLSNTVGNRNTLIGKGSGSAMTGTISNTFVGWHSGSVTTTGQNNTFLGASSGILNEDGDFNAFVGTTSGASNISGTDNTFIGSRAGTDNTIGNRNTFVGRFSGDNCITCDSSSSLGYATAFSIFNFDNATAIGVASTCSASNKVRIGNTQVTVVEGQVAYSFPSDGRFKFNVQSNVPGLAFIEKLRPVTYQFDMTEYHAHIQPEGWEQKLDSVELINVIKATGRSGQTVHTGFIAQEVEAAANEIGFDFDGVVKPQNEKDNYGLRYAEFVVPLVKAVQELSADNKSLREALSEQQAINHSVHKQLIALQQLISSIQH